MNQKNKYKSTKVASGKRVQPPAPKPISLTNADFLRTAQYGLYGLSNEKNFYVNSIILYNNQHPYTLNSKQIKYLTGLFRGVDKYLSQNTLIDPSNHRITKIIRRKTINLARWSKAYQSQLALQALPNNLWAACTRLLDFISEYVESFYFIDNLIEDIKKISNRPADFALRVMVDDIIHNYQLQRNTNKYPTYPYVIKALNNHRTGLSKIQLSARQYFNFKLWRARGSYWWYIQP
jgi:hypothetical protein